jgi:hypothetical protein
MSNAYLTRMPCGVAGDISRKELSKVEPRFMDSTLPVPLYGVPVKMVSEKVYGFTTDDDAVVPYGFAVRPYPFQAAVSEALVAGTPNPTQPLDVLRSGYMTVKNNAGVPALGGAVYVRVVDSGLAAQPLGGIEAAADGGECVAITGAIFMGTADADGNVEISYNI